MKQHTLLQMFLISSTMNLPGGKSLEICYAYTKRHIYRKTMNKTETM